jgi:hypothetical protein
MANRLSAPLTDDRCVAIEATTTALRTTRSWRRTALLTEGLVHDAVHEAARCCQVTIT